MTHCYHCGKWLHAGAEWRLHPDLTPGKLETEYDDDIQRPYLHDDGCYQEYLEVRD